MAGEQLHAFLRRLRRLSPEMGGASDAELLERFVTSRDEAAFEVLVWRHGGLVLRVCGRLLRRAEDVEDVFQATFLTLTRSGGSIGKAEVVSSWLYKVAYRLALRVRARLSSGERPPNKLTLVAPAARQLEPDVGPVLDEEINRLPRKYRVPVVLCYLEGKSTEEAARQLGCPRGTVCSRLSWARQRLRDRLTRRGLGLTPAGLAALLLPGAAQASASPSPLVGATVKAAVLFASSQPATLTGPAGILAEGVLRTMLLTKLKVAAGVLLVLGVLGLGAGVYAQRIAAEKPGGDETPVLVRGSDGVRLPTTLRDRLGIRTAEVKPRMGTTSRVLRLSGSLALEPSHLSRVRIRFTPAKVKQLGSSTESRELRAGDRVKKGDILAVLFSAEVGSKKSELYHALIQRKLDEETLHRMEKARDAIPEVRYLQQVRTVQADRNAVRRAEIALAAWGIPDKEIEAVRQAAKEAGERKGKPLTEAERKARRENWAKVELRAPSDGTIVERNVIRSEVVVDGDVNLFTLASLDRLPVLAHVNEADLPALSALKPEQRQWTIRGAGDPSGPAGRGRFGEVGYVIDPNQRTAVIKGYVENPDGRLRPGQSITASISLPGRTDEVVLPAAAVVEQGGQTYLFVQTEAGKSFYEQRRVLVVRRGHDQVHVRSRLTPEQERQGFKTVRMGERIVTSGAIELQAILDDLKGGEGR
jgi:cobalt-zinc-cadmium efflux system membrane fusion protein